MTATQKLEAARTNLRAAFAAYAAAQREWEDSREIVDGDYAVFPSAAVTTLGEMADGLERDGTWTDSLTED